jgi:hypothetical protein
MTGGGVTDIKSVRRAVEAQDITPGPKALCCLQALGCGN